jgi:uncharacterized protein
VRLVDSELFVSATDLSNFLSCRHRTALELGEAYGARKRPRFNDPFLEILAQRGREHEKTYVESQRTGDRRVVDLSDVKDIRAALPLTLEALRAGADVVVQGALSDGRWYGRPDVLLRVEAAGGFGAWSYEAVDTKLSRETRAGTILQLGLYSEMLGVAQGRRPEHFHVVTPFAPHPYRVDDYAAYFRLIRSEMASTVLQDHAALFAAHYPEPVPHCDVCCWSSECNRKRRADDHLSLVAGITRLQRRELESRGVVTLAGLAAVPVPLPFRPSRGSASALSRVREQARVQFASRSSASPVWELRPFVAGAGLSRLPEPSAGDVFLDLEGDPFAAVGGREYLFGVVTLDSSGVPSYREFWAFDEAQERAAFCSVMDLILSSWKAEPGMHVYHYAPYEPSAFKRLMGRYATRGQELDRLLRSGRFVDLYAVVREGVLAGVERYSIKDLEAFYSFSRSVPLVDAGRCRSAMEQALELGSAASVLDSVRDAVLGYNRDDCLSTLRLRDWLETLRSGLVSRGTAVERPSSESGEATPELDAREQRVFALRARLLAAVPEVVASQSAEQHARWLLAYLLDWHRREDKAAWWEYYRLRELPEEDLFHEPKAVAGLVFVSRVLEVLGKKGKPTGSVVDRYRYPLQEMEIRAGEELKAQDGKKWGEVVDVDRKALTIDVKKGPSKAELHPSAVFEHTQFSSAVMEDALFSIGEEWGQGDPVGRSLLLRLPPALRSGSFVPGPGESSVEFAVRLAPLLSSTVLAIQGPPGTGKTYTAAQMICELVREGRKVGVTATSHAVIANLLQAVRDASGTSGAVRVGHKCDDELSNDDARAALLSGEVNVLGGTAWMWARPEFASSVDVLFVDEAGQMSLANVLALSRAPGSLVLIGDPQQLEQPQKGTHPEGVNASALQHILGSDTTIPASRGLFLSVTRRLAPAICSFTSELFYSGRLFPMAGLERQALVGVPGLEGSGLWYVDVAHSGNSNSSEEEIAVVLDLVSRLTAAGSSWVDSRGESLPVRGSDILVVSPYNAQVSRLDERLSPLGVRAGTVDKFQGQEAPIVLYSMATSTPEDAPRGMEFLYSLNRLNVATSRARCAAVLVASPRLFEPECRTPRQMKLANALCRFRELARDFTR